MTKRKLPAMHEVYGTQPQHKCRDCCNLIVYASGKRMFYKCKAYGDTASQATDWGVNYLACGMFNVPMGDNMLPLIERIWRQKSEGQMEVEL